MDRKSARKYRDRRQLPAEARKPRTWRTRPDPLAEVWPAVAEQLQQQPRLQAKTLWDWVQRSQPGKCAESARRTLERRVRQWKAQQGPAKEVFFAQVHAPGRLAASDFTSMNDLQVTIQGEPLPALAVPLRADPFELGACHALFFRELRQPERRPAERLVGPGRRASAPSHRSHDAGRPSRWPPRRVHGRLSGLAGALWPGGGGDQPGQRE